MECIYVPELVTDSVSVDIPDTEVHHLKALRVESGDKILLINGTGLSATADIERISKYKYIAHTIKFEYGIGEPAYKIGLAIGILNDRSRFEFAIEKATELGVSDIFPLITEYVQRKEINMERLHQKIIAAIEQCKRSMLPKLHSPIKLDELIHSTHQFGYSTLVIADINGTLPNRINNNCLAFVGCEGGFSQKDLSLFPSNVLKWNLGNRRLRTETAGLAMLSLISI